MSKRPSLGPETVVRKSRLAAKGEAVPALVHGQHSHNDHPDAGTVAPVAAPVAPAPESVAQPAVDGLLATLAERDRQLEGARADIARLERDHAEERAAAARERGQLEQIRADFQRVERDRAEERAAATQDHDQMVANLAAADATIDELRNRLGDLREQLERSRVEVNRLIEHHATERHILLENHKAECERLMAVAARPPAPTPTQALPAPTPALGGALQSAKRWLFGDEPVAKNPTPVNTRSVTAQQKPSGYQPRAAAVQSPGPGPGPAKPSVVKPVVPPTAPKVLNRRPVG